MAALIATVTFSAAFALPGGFGEQDPHKARAVLVRNAAFQAFVKSDATDMII